MFHTSICAGLNICTSSSILPEAGEKRQSNSHETTITHAAGVPNLSRSALNSSEWAAAFDHLDVAVIGSSDCVHHPVPDARLPPSHKAVAAGRVRPIALWQVAPWRTGPQHPE